MKRTWIVAGLLLSTGTGCSAMNNTEAGALGGGIIGGGLGTVIGAATGHPLAGAAIGAGAGALTGGAIGNAEDRREQKQVQAVQQWAARNQMTMTDVITMTHQHVNDSVIINQMDTTYTNFDLRPADITVLQQQGVSDRVIMAMQTRRTPPPGAYAVRPVGGVVVYEPPPPPVSVGIGFSSGGYGPGWRRGCW
jgi:outer membrane lipoprotein SlyB